jgi:DNA-binding MarR family transcriptional regulator
MNNLLYTVQIMNNQQKEDSATLEILQTIENQDDVTQRHLADKLDVALGLTNSYLKRCIHKGLVKVKQAPANRYLYYLTPQGFAEKSRLTAAYLSASFNFYRDASESINQLFNFCEKKDWNRILFCGVSELAEIASIRAQEHDIEIVGTWDPENENKSFLYLKVWNSLLEVEGFDAALLTSLNNTESLLNEFVKNNSREKILVPTILGIT